MYYPVTNIFFLEPSSIVLGKACDSSYKSISYNSCRSKANTKYIFEEYEIIKGKSLVLMYSVQQQKKSKTVSKREYISMSVILWLIAFSRADDIYKSI